MRWRILVSLISLAVIFFGVDYAIGRERLRNPEHLHALYQQTNKEFFGGQLLDVEVKAHDLSEEKAEGITYRETKDRFVIVLDPRWNTSEAEALDTMRHEACHVATWDVVDRNDRHGPAFQECMKRFEEKCGEILSTFICLEPKINVNKLSTSSASPDTVSGDQTQ